MYNPCRFGHRFNWAGNSAHPASEPPEGLPCACGAVRYQRRNLWKRWSRPRRGRMPVRQRLDKSGAGVI